MSLVPCPHCHRHIRIREPVCPFCGTTLDASLASRAVPGAAQRLSRAAAFAFTATLAMTHCGPTTTPPPGDAATDGSGNNDEGTVMALYGAPVDVPASRQDAGPSDNGTVMALYGAPVDAGPALDAPVRDNGGIAPLYGAPVDAGPAPDAPVRDNGGIAPLYGAVPAPDGSADAAEGSIGVRYGAPPREV